MKKNIGLLAIIVVLILGASALFISQHNVNAQSQTKELNPVRTQVRASHILVNSQDQALRIKSDIENGDITFEDAAKKYSLCPSGQNGGDLGYFSKGMMVKEFEDASFTLPINKISDPIKTQFGYHLIKVTKTK